MSDVHMTLVQKLREGGSVGLDLSPGDHLCNQAADEIELLRNALSVALQGLGQLAKSGENRSRSRPSRAHLIKKTEQTLERVARVLEGHPTYIGVYGHVCLHTLPDKSHE